MNTQRFILSAVAVFVFIFVFNYVVHGHLLMPMYNETMSVWRPMDQMMAMMPWDIIVQAALSLVVTYLFTRHYENKGYEEGARYGLYIGLIMAIVQFDAYVYLPIPLSLAVSWLVAYVVEGVGIGLVLSATYRNA